MSYIDPTAGAGATGASSPAPSSSTTGLNQLDNSQTFLKLLVAQLKNQNPDNPTDPTSFMTEIAQMTAVQSQTTLNAEEQTVAADSMIGWSVTGNEASGGQVSGVVTGVLLSSSGAPELQLSVPGVTGTVPTLALDQVTRVYAATTAATTAAPSSSTNSTTTSSTTTA